MSRHGLRGMRLAAMLLLLGAGGCGQAMGQPGGVLWTLTANDHERQHFGGERLSTARMQCAQSGYHGEAHEACVRNAMKH